MIFIRSLLAILCLVSCTDQIVKGEDQKSNVTVTDGDKPAPNEDQVECTGDHCTKNDILNDPPAAFDADTPIRYPNKNELGLFSSYITAYVGKVATSTDHLSEGFPAARKVAKRIRASTNSRRKQTYSMSENEDEDDKEDNEHFLPQTYHDEDLNGDDYDDEDAGGYPGIHDLYDDDDDDEDIGNDEDDYDDSDNVRATKLTAKQLKELTRGISALSNQLLNRKRKGKSELIAPETKQLLKKIVLLDASPSTVQLEQTHHSKYDAALLRELKAIKALARASFGHNLRVFNSHPKLLNSDRDHRHTSRNRRPLDYDHHGHRPYYAHPGEYKPFKDGRNYRRHGDVFYHGNPERNGRYNEPPRRPYHGY